MSASHLLLKHGLNPSLTLRSKPSLMHVQSPKHMGEILELANCKALKLLDKCRDLQLDPTTFEVFLKKKIAEFNFLMYSPLVTRENPHRSFDDHQDTVQEVPTSDILVVAGEWNARTGPVDENTRHTLGRYATQKGA